MYSPLISSGMETYQANKFGGKVRSRFAKPSTQDFPPYTHEEAGFDCWKFPGFDVTEEEEKKTRVLNNRKDVLFLVRY